jgi:hypothetical protein
MENNLKFLGKWKTTSILLENRTEDNIHRLRKWKTASIIMAKGRQPQLFRQMEDNINFLGK